MGGESPQPTLAGQALRDDAVSLASPELGRRNPGGNRSLCQVSSLKGLNTLSPGRLKSRSLPVAIVSPCRRAVAAM